MRRIRILAFAGAAVLLSTAVSAFQEQQGSASGPTSKADGAAAAVVGVPSADKVGAAPDAGARVLGTEVRIPGLGSLGVLPKMDFGLELLYGAADQRRMEEDRGRANDDFAVKGTLRRKF